MTSETARRLGWAVVAAGVASLAAGLWLRQAALAQKPDLRRAAAPLRSAVEEALLAEGKALGPTAATAARIPELAAALAMGADRATLADLIETEDWWAPFRGHFSLSGVVTQKGPNAVLGPAPIGIADTDVARTAREQGSGMGVVNGGDRPFLVAAARVLGTHAPEQGAIVLLGTPLDEAALKEIGAAAHAAVAISDGARLVASSGRDGAGDGRGGLAALVGSETRGAALLPDGRLATAWALSGGFWMLAAGPAPPPVAPGPLPLVVLVGGAALLLLGIAVGQLSRTAGAGNPPEHRRGSRPREEWTPRAPAPRAPTPQAPWPVEGSPGATQVGTLATGAAVASAGNAGGVHMGRYRLIERIGEGGMAEIFFAAAYGAEDFVRHFVVKRMHPHLARNREAVNQFIDEARLQAGLVHSNIVPVFDFGKAGDEYFLALEYIHGRDIGQIVQRHLEKLDQPMSVPIAFYLMHQVMEALAFAHAQVGADGAPLDIVHRDVAPGNVLVSYQGEVKLTDFGIAKSERRVSRTEVGMVKGNASFMSPEQARGESVDRRSDIFSAGLVLFYCLTAQTLYRGETTLNRLMRAAVGPATSQFDKIEQLPVAAARILRRAVALDPAQRYSNAAELARELASEMATRSDMARLMDLLFPPSERRTLR